MNRPGSGGERRGGELRGEGGLRANVGFHTHGHSSDNIYPTIYLERCLCGRKIKYIVVAIFSTDIYNDQLMRCIIYFLFLFLPLPNLSHILFMLVAVVLPTYTASQRPAYEVILCFPYRFAIADFLMCVFPVRTSSGAFACDDQRPAGLLS